MDTYTKENGTSQNPSAPAKVFHVMDFVNDELEARGWNLDVLAVRMGGDASRNLLALQILDNVREPGVLLGEESAAAIGNAFGTGAKLWLNLDDTWQRYAKTRSAALAATQE